jgi:hypothetical protein
MSFGDHLEASEQMMEESQPPLSKIISMRTSNEYAVSEATINAMVNAEYNSFNHLAN